MKKVTDDIYRGCCYGYFVIYDEISNIDYDNFVDKKWCGLYILDNVSTETKDWISIRRYKTSLKNTLDDHFVPTMIHYLKINKVNSNDIIKQFFIDEYDSYYKLYQHGFLKRIPFIDIKYNVDVDNFLKKYHYFYNETNQLFVHDRYKYL
tara:strand:+ start:513 stop:962 length:450 start_codon:yes stop_codon:yes gene_type:complete